MHDETLTITINFLGYVDKCISKILVDVMKPSEKKKVVLKVPPSLSEDRERVSKEEALKMHCKRYTAKK